MHCHMIMRFYSMVEGHAKWWLCEACDHWPNGGAIALNWKCKLWMLIAHEPFDRWRWYLYSLVRLLMPNNFCIMTFDLWPLDLPPFRIMWKTDTMLVLLEHLIKMHENYIDVNFGPMRTRPAQVNWFKPQWWRYSTQLKMQTLYAHSSWTVWPLVMIPIITCAAAYAEQLLYCDFWPLTFRSSAI